MPVEWSAETVLALAPDPASAKAGQGLATARSWQNLGRGSGLIWGECRGSGAKPYQVKVDPDGPAFGCSCPSRKFPCKHALGLMLIAASGPSSLAVADPPDWVASWKEAREKKADQAREKAEAPPAPVDAAAKARREAARLAKVASGMDDLALWLADLVGQGLANLGARPGNPWDAQARRMVDAQAPGVARRLRQIDDMPLSGEGWQAGLLDRLAGLHLLCEGFRRREALPPEVADDVLATIGFPADMDAIRSGPGVRDHWQVIGESFATEANLSVLRTWLIGRDTGRAALVLDFAAGGKVHDRTMPPGIVLDADLAFFPGGYPLRALVKDRRPEAEPLRRLSCGTTVSGAFARYGSALAIHPWIELVPVVLDHVVLVERDGAWSARDATGATIPIANRFFRGWDLLALEGGGPLALCGEFDGARLEALGAIAGGAYFPLLTGAMGSRDLAMVAPPVEVPLLAEAVASAIVGTSRRPPPVPAGDDPIAEAVGGLSGLEPASRLLAVSAAATLYGRAGRKPAIDPSPPPPPCPPDDRPECSTAQARRLGPMIVGHPRGEHADCLPEWIGLLADSGARVPHSAIVNVLHQYEDRSDPVDPLRRALGVRGRWLAAQNARWRKFSGLNQGEDVASAWETGTRPRRLAALRALRGSDPALGLALVESSFASEPADARAEFLRELERGLSMEDEPFLESALDDRAKDVRRQAADLLRRLPESRLCRRMIERARACLSWKGGLLGLGRGTLTVEPPSACDKAMARDGVEPKRPAGSSLGERAWWLCEVIAATPTAAISEGLGVSPARLVAASRGGEWESAIFSGWAVSAVRLRDAAWAEALLEAGPERPSPERMQAQDRYLLTVLPPGRRDALLARRIAADRAPLNARHPAFDLVDSLDGPVGADLAREILRRVRPILADERSHFADPSRRAAATHAEWGAAFEPAYHDYAVSGLLQKLGAILPLELADEAAEVPGDGPRDLFYALAYATMLDRLRFRRDMHREFAP